MIAGWWAQQTAPDCIGGEKAGTYDELAAVAD